MKIRNKRNLLILSLKISTPFLRNNRYFSKDNDCLWGFLLYMDRQAILYEHTFRFHTKQ